MRGKCNANVLPTQWRFSDNATHRHCDAKLRRATSGIHLRRLRNKESIRGGPPTAVSMWRRRSDGPRIGYPWSCWPTSGQPLEWLVHRRTFWSAGTTSRPPSGCSVHLWTTPRAAGPTLGFQWRRLTTRGHQRLTGGAPTWPALELLDDRRISPRAGAPQADLSWSGWPPLGLPWGSCSTSGPHPGMVKGPPVSSPGVASPPVGSPWSGWSTSGPPMGWLVHQMAPPCTGGGPNS